MDNQKQKATYARTIPKELLEAWQKYRRRCDGETIADALGYSRPVIDRALNFGYVKTAGLTEKISEFFTDRLNKERTAATALTDLLNQ